MNMLGRLPAMSGTQKDRRRVLERLLARGKPRTQVELSEALAAAGFPATQPVVSRDLRALGALKVGGRYALPSEERITPLEALGSLLRSSASAGPNLVVLTCEPGAASAIARALESEEGLSMVGTVAGDDSVFVAVNSKKAGADIRRRIHSLL